MKLLLIHFFAITFSFFAKAQFCVIQADGIKSISRIRMNYEDGQLKSSDTIHDFIVLNCNGKKIIEKDYFLNYKVNHMFYYNTEGNISSKVILIQNDKKVSLTTSDTIEYETYEYNDHKLLIKSINKKYWNDSAIYTTCYSYNNEDMLVSKIQTDNSGNIEAFSIYDYSQSNDTILDFSVSDFGGMTKSYSYRYREDGITLESRRRWWQDYLETEYYDETGKYLSYVTITQNGKLIAQTDYSYHNELLIQESYYFITEDKQKEMALITRYVYK